MTPGGHPGEGPCALALVNVSSPSAPLAGLQPSITGRFWASPRGSAWMKTSAALLVESAAAETSPSAHCCPFIDHAL